MPSLHMQVPAGAANVCLGLSQQNSQQQNSPTVPVPARIQRVMWGEGGTPESHKVQVGTCQGQPQVGVLGLSCPPSLQAQHPSQAVKGVERGHREKGTSKAIRSGQCPNPPGAGKDFRPQHRGGN